MILEYQQATPVRSIQLAEGGKMFLCVTDASYRNTPAILLYKIPKQALETNDYIDKSMYHHTIENINRLFLLT